MAFREWREWPQETWVPDRGARPRPKPGIPDWVFAPSPSHTPPIDPSQDIPGERLPPARGKPRPHGPPARPNFPNPPRPKLPPPGGWLGGIGIGLGAAGALDAYFDAARNPRPFVPPGYWVFRCASGLLPGMPPYMNTSSPNQGPYLSLWAGQICNLSSGQVPPALNAPLTPYTTLHIGSTSRDTLILSDSQLQSGTALRFRNDVCWNYIQPGDHPAFDATYRPGTWPGLGPSPQPMPDPNNAPWPADAPGYNPVPSGAPSPETVPETAPAPQTAPPEWSWTSGDTAPRPTYPRPPRPGTKEVKVISRAKRIGIFLWKLMDNISETTEIVAGFYKALPEEVQKRWDCGSGINIGQYGSDVNACMAKALWHNWHRIDPGRAFIEVTKNLVEDMSIGAFHKMMAKLYPPGFSVRRTVVTHALTKLEMEKYIAGHLSDLFEWMGLDPE